MGWFGARTRDGRDAADPETTDEDVRLMLAVRAGDAAAFRTLFERHYAGVVQFCLRLVGDRESAEDLAQETFLRIHLARERYEPSARFKTYLLTVAGRLCFNERRRPARRAGPAVPIDAPRGAEGDGPLLALAAPGPDPEGAAAERQRLARVCAVLAEMPPRQRTATVLHRYEGLSHEEVAEVLGCSTRAVKSLLHRSRVLIVKSMLATGLDELTAAGLDVQIGGVA